MTKVVDDFLLEWQSDPRFALWLEDVMKLRPVVPYHNPTEDNTEVWKAMSAERRGFDIWLNALKIKP